MSTASLVSLSIIKTTYGVLTILQRNLGNDLDMALVSLAIALRTRSDLFEIEEQSSWDENAGAKIETEQHFYTSINEIAQFTEMNRATVRRKMLRLEVLNVIEKVSDDQWCFVDPNHETHSMLKVLHQQLLENYLHFGSKLAQFLPEEAKQLKRGVSSTPTTQTVKALQPEDVSKKLKRKLLVRNG